MSRFAKLLGPVALALIGTAMAPAVASAKPDKVSICHRDADTWKLINVSDRASAAHLRHGDGRPGEPVPGQNGSTFDESCVPTQNAACFESSFDEGYDLWFLDFEHFEFRQSNDGTCTPPAAAFPGGVRFVAVVVADSTEEAAMRCENLDGALGFHVSSAYPVPETWWTCTDS